MSRLIEPKTLVIEASRSLFRVFRGYISFLIACLGLTFSALAQPPGGIC